jgi:uncharacterized protein YukE
MTTHHSHKPTHRAAHTISANPDNLRAAATQLASAADDVHALAAHFKEIEAAVRKEVSAHTADGGPAPVFSPLLAALTTSTRKSIGQVHQLHENIASDAAALKKLADDLEGADNSGGNNVNGIVV